ncbi:MAG: hypothetical protein MJZ20_05425 [Bacteroidaceae bacterium]|nr:hypothetical protein [Bacteroidaceae bacterium]
MKKQYTTPKSKVVSVRPSAIICVSVTFGSGSTEVMHTKDVNGIENENEYKGYRF